MIGFEHEEYAWTSVMAYLHRSNGLFDVWYSCILAAHIDDLTILSANDNLWTYLVGKTVLTMG